MTPPKVMRLLQLFSVENGRAVETGQGHRPWWNRGKSLDSLVILGIISKQVIPSIINMYVALMPWYIGISSHK